MKSVHTQKYYESALSQKERWFLDNSGALMAPFMALGMVSLLILPMFLFGQVEEGENILPLQITTASLLLFALTVWIILWSQESRLTKLELAKIDQILENQLSAPLKDWFGSDDLASLYHEMTDPGIKNRKHSWHYADEMTLHRISHEKNENLYMVETKTITPEDLKLIINFGHDQKIIDSILVNTESADTQTDTHNAPANTATSITDWFKALRKGVTADLIPVVTDFRQFIDVANLTETTEEEKHTLERLLSDSAEATVLYQKIITSASVLPNADEITAEAEAVLTKTINALKDEAEKLVTNQASTAMENLRVHANYVNTPR